MQRRCGPQGSTAASRSRETATLLPLVTAASAGLDLYTNVAIAFPRSPMHLAYQGWDLQRATGGRFALGLGTQIKPHIERRYSSTWDRPVGRMVDIVKATKRSGRTGPTARRSITSPTSTGSI